MGIKLFLALFGVLLGVLSYSEEALACNSCGQGFSFTPKMLMISAGFFLLPVSIVGLIVWRVWRDEKRSQYQGQDPSSQLDAPTETR